MKKKTKQLYKTIGFNSSITALAMSFSLLSPELTNADSINLKEAFKQQQQKANQVNPVPVPSNDVKGLQDLWGNSNTIKAPLADLIGVAPDSLSNFGFNFVYFKEPSYSVDLIKKNNEGLTSPVYLGTSNLSHSGGTSEQTLYSSSFSNAVTETLTATTTHGAKVGAKAGAKFKVPLVAEANAELSAEYNFSQAGTNTSSQTVTYTIPSQPVKLQPNEIAEVTASLKMVESSGDVKLCTTYTGEVQSTFTYNTQHGPMQDYDITGLGDWMKTILDFDRDLKNNWAYSPAYASVAYQYGYGTYNATYGTKADINVKIFNKSNKTKDAFSTPIRSYSYEVTPEISKNS
ncbi:ETX/MTX2 family pore-forming toxin [Bacillus wiedmannii]|uniref:ETX/MTX2 family pore-forming toxin n=1 Tax=Bacillus wiedmannii TaxID=1890302 RepID=UPI000B446E32|nr:ETX/MTX2 family pore-forming toxin [Bacillus wiedmannii]OUB80919.1 hypothetical protein BK788_25145 [Bacillus thuringiensis serovar sinensis]